MELVVLLPEGEVGPGVTSRDWLYAISRSYMGLESSYGSTSYTSTDTIKWEKVTSKSENRDWKISSFPGTHF